MAMANLTTTGYGDSEGDGDGDSEGDGDGDSEGDGDGDSFHFCFLVCSLFDTFTSPSVSS